MRPDITAEEIIERYHLVPLEFEGGMFCQSYYSDEMLPGSAIPGREGDHPVGTAIMFLISGNGYSRLHRLPTDEIWHYYMGDTVEMLQLEPDGSGRKVYLGHDILNGEEVQTTVTRGTWQGAHLAEGGSWALVGTTMAPGMLGIDYEDGDRDALRAQYPEFAGLIDVLLAGAPAYE